MTAKTVLIADDDSAIRDAQFNDLGRLRHTAPGLCAIAHNGATSASAASMDLLRLA